MFENATNQSLVLGGPGCGKTTRLLDLIDQHIKDGQSPNRIAFISFTTKAASEAVERASLRFDIPRESFPHFRTIHSMAYRGAGITRNMVMQRSDYRELGEQLGIRFSAYGDLEEGAGGSGAEGNRMLSLVDYARATEKDLRAAWLDADTDIEWHALKRFDEALRRYKDNSGKVDFSDMLTIYASSGEPLDVDVGIIDEAQDLSTLQWRTAARGLQEATEVIIAGDDDQAIHTWNGASIDTFLKLPAVVDELPVSYRLSPEVHSVGRKISAQIARRRPKHWQPATHQGAVNWMPSAEAIDPKEGTWYFLARNKMFLAPLEEAVRAMGYAYTTAHGSTIKADHLAAIKAWEHLRNGKGPISGTDLENMLALISGRRHRTHYEWYSKEDVVNDVGHLPWDLPWFSALKNIHINQREYYRACLRRGENLEEPRIYIGTIHSVKGGEADSVVLSLDMTQRTYEHYQRDSDDEHRVFYVGATRARRDLYLIPPQGEFGYEL